MGTAQENFDKGVQLRLEGNEAFKKQDLKQALTHYYNALLHLKAVGGQKEESKFKQQSSEQLVMIYNNMSAVFAKQDRWDRVLFYATKANELDPTNTKSKFRMGQAHLRTENIEIAKSLLEEVLKQNPGDALVKQELAKVAAANKSMDEKEKLIYRAMMSKLNEEKNSTKK
ncbi:hypothetical protein V8B55DRAFT_1448966 [Mucor lusitanicus]|uniref:Uncharacterized protein n=2 Tax=Mucor circinelloides f. lusitanicus TaxID=29924 RepID=A0A162R8P3_MUCCL|nr:hypothetical protein MUCCIDRAFT_162878 [Mucor lusitanicus CBS 277.49]